MITLHLTVSELSTSKSYVTVKGQTPDGFGSLITLSREHNSAEDCEAVENLKLHQKVTIVIEKDSQ